MTIANTFLRRAILPAASKSTQQQVRLVSTTLGGARSALASLSSQLPNNVENTRRGMATISAGDALARLASDHPHQEIIRYEHKNVKWTLKHVNYYSDALACGLLDAGLKPGDVMLSWLPLHVAEQVSFVRGYWIIYCCNIIAIYQVKDGLLFTFVMYYYSHIMC